ncbi:Thiolase, N-terminal domain-containing protein [Lipomyces kononenkoae]|uniref:Thiolase, N-terminal domain-containing protein n=1 Tax=Lipomyces kononenkoae TaxID=34357 RepID=A0ACC3SU90_LIPKO
MESVKAASGLLRRSLRISYRQFHAATSRYREGDDVYIISAARTPVGKFNGALKSLSATQLGTKAVRAAVERSGLSDLAQVPEVYMGHVLQANTGQSPARQVTLGAGFPVSTDSTTINKVCASGLKAVMLAAQNIQTGIAEVMVAGGMESMSNAPFYLERNRAYGHHTVTDAIIKDGLWDVYGDIHMGSCGENTARKFNITREMQDSYAMESYRRAIHAQENNLFQHEIVPVETKLRGKPVIVSDDEEPASVNLAKLPTLRPAFEPEGTITAGNASPINDGAAAVVLASESRLDRYDDLIRPLGVIVSYADAATDPIDFTIAPALAIPRALMRARLDIQDIAKFEINEAFSAVALANLELLGLDPAKVNVKGGAVALGHAIGSSGCRILVTLLYSLKEGEYGVAAICNGGGGSSAVVVRRM